MPPSAAQARWFAPMHAVTAAMALAATMPLQAMAAGYNSQVLSPLLLGAQSYHLALGPTGAVVGTSLVNVLSVPRQAERSVLWAAGSTTPRSVKCLPATVPASATPCLAQDINRSGTMVGWSAFQREATKRAVVWASGSAAPVDLSADLSAAGLNGQESLATHVNDAGWVLGLATAPGQLELRPFVWRSRQATRLAEPGPQITMIRTMGLNQAGMAVAVGLDVSQSPPREVGLIWHPDGRLQTLADFSPRGLSEAGHVVGNRFEQIGVWHQGSFRWLPTTPGVSDFAETINSAGVVGGQQVATNGSPVATLWEANGRALALSTLATPPSGFRFQRLEEINDAGQMAVTATNAGKVRTVVLTPRP
jgi:uncharacterized membrane protein